MSTIPPTARVLEFPALPTIPVEENLATLTLPELHRSIEAHRALLRHMEFGVEMLRQLLREREDMLRRFESNNHQIALPAAAVR